MEGPILHTLLVTIFTSKHILLLKDFAFAVTVPRSSSRSSLMTRTAFSSFVFNFCQGPLLSPPFAMNGEIWGPGASYINILNPPHSSFLSPAYSLTQIPLSIYLLVH